MEEHPHGATPMRPAAPAPTTAPVAADDSGAPGGPGNTRAGVVHRDATVGGGGEVPGVAPRAGDRAEYLRPPPPSTSPTAANGDLRGTASAALGAAGGGRQTIDQATLVARERAAAVAARTGGASAVDPAATASGDGQRPAGGATTVPGGADAPAPPAPGTVAARADDAVARQLAALIARERDPVLREKLRLEYERYVSGL